MIFLKVQTPQDKINHILQITHNHFQKGNDLLLLTSDQQTTTYLDLLLWRHPKDSFLPHDLLGMKGSSGPIYIGTIDAPYSTFQSIFNLSGNPIESEHNRIYEFDGGLNSKKHYHFYKEKGLCIITS